MATNERMRILRRELKEYLATRSVTLDERRELEEWIRQGFSVHENPWYFYTEDGTPADYLAAKRTVNELCEQAMN